MENIHIGAKIKERAVQLRIGPTELAEMIKTSYSNVFKIYESQHINTHRLITISKAFDYNFLLYYIKPKDLKNLKAKKRGY